jgi:hypothetical protein
MEKRKEQILVRHLRANCSQKYQKGVEESRWVGSGYCWEALLKVVSSIELCRGISRGCALVAEIHLPPFFGRVLGARDA